MTDKEYMAWRSSWIKRYANGVSESIVTSHACDATRAKMQKETNENLAANNQSLRSSIDQINKLRAEKEGILQDLYSVMEKRANLRAKLIIAKEGLAKIQDGGVPMGESANVEERMLAMCATANETLAKIKENS